mmetsp:Transcript_1448/g.3465  ORF Transcript_1448/g.3465 Transcript_1448/m.3465 type:complete len:268 (+) Transcript_1448:1482-2285(+)
MRLPCRWPTPASSRPFLALEVLQSTRSETSPVLALIFPTLVFPSRVPLTRSPRHARWLRKLSRPRWDPPRCLKDRPSLRLTSELPPEESLALEDPTLQGSRVTATSPSTSRGAHTATSWVLRRALTRPRLRSWTPSSVTKRPSPRPRPARRRLLDLPLSLRPRRRRSNRLEKPLLPRPERISRKHLLLLRLQRRLLSLWPLPRLQSLLLLRLLLPLLRLYQLLITRHGNPLPAPGAPMMLGAQRATLTAPRTAGDSKSVWSRVLLVS